MNSSASSRNSNISEGNRTDIALPLAAVISLAITSYVIVVLVGIAIRKWLLRICCSSTESTTDYFCDIGSYCFASDSTAACCGNSGINCCSSPVMNCCTAGTSNSCIFFKSCWGSSQPIDCQPCDCCCFEIAFHLKGQRSAGSGPLP
ncbi:uncharacterized protein LOC132087695 [Daphnia carinata]|uniref:uncharacterized protein LOC132087695 n=1 Tax=Daphnia carinata TaxID=120202 RepID=UPI00257EC65B|nr:uncharacterized protein LOC132087695 [Daphnia carinata]